MNIFIVDINFSGYAINEVQTSFELQDMFLFVFTHI